jgi:23S rRNA (uracil1939-C5)-methyltransferase
VQHPEEIVLIEKLVHGGQGMGRLADGKRVFVWNALPNEGVKVQLLKGRRDYAEAVAVEIVTRSHQRIEPVDEAYMSTSPWQIMTESAEQTYKTEILQEVFAREGVQLSQVNFAIPPSYFAYRNKMEYSFWADDEGLHLALFHRGSHGKRIVEGSSIAMPAIDEAAQKIVKILNEASIRGSQLKTMVLRSNQAGEVVAALYVKDEMFPKVAALESVCRGVAVCYSTPKSPASVLTKQLYQFGEITIRDAVRGRDFLYDVFSFFQVNIPVFEHALADIADFTAGSNNIVDMYAGVGSIGLCVGANMLVELDGNNVTMARRNAGEDTEVVHASTEQALEYITAQAAVVVDPPRAGLHAKVIERILEARPPKVAYLSCNPSTQARDVGVLADSYRIVSAHGYNFFPRTPHIESLILLELKS